MLRRWSLSLPRERLGVEDEPELRLEPLLILSIGLAADADVFVPGQQLRGEGSVECGQIFESGDLNGIRFGSPHAVELGVRLK